MRAGNLARFEYAVLPIVLCLFAYGSNRSYAGLSEKAPKCYSKPSQCGTPGRDKKKVSNLDRALYRLGVKAGKLDRKNGRLNMDDMVANMSMDPPTALLYIGGLPFYEKDDLTKEATKLYKELEKLPYEKQKMALKYFVEGYSSQRPAPGTGTSTSTRRGGPTGKSGRRRRSPAKGRP